MGWLDGQVALVTGGGSGIGRAVVERYVEEGARVAVMDRVAGRGEELRARFGDKVTAISRRRQPARRQQAGGRGNCRRLRPARHFRRQCRACSTVSCRLADMAEDQLAAACDELFAVNVKGCILGAKAALPELAQEQGLHDLHRVGGGIYLGWRRRDLYRLKACGGRHHPAIGGRTGAGYPGQRRRARRHDDRSAQCRGLATRRPLAIRASGRGASGSPPATRCTLALDPADLAGAYVFLASRANARGITGSVVSVDAGSTLRMMRRGWQRRGCPRIKSVG